MKQKVISIIICLALLLLCGCEETTTSEAVSGTIDLLYSSDENKSSIAIYTSSVSYASAVSAYSNDIRKIHEALGQDIERKYILEITDLKIIDDYYNPYGGCVYGNLYKAKVVYAYKGKVKKGDAVNIFGMDDYKVSRNLEQGVQLNYIITSNQFYQGKFSVIEYDSFEINSDNQVTYSYPQRPKLTSSNYEYFKKVFIQYLDYVDKNKLDSTE